MQRELDPNENEVVAGLGSEGQELLQPTLPQNIPTPLVPAEDSLSLDTALLQTNTRRLLLSNPTQMFLHRISDFPLADLKRIKNSLAESLHLALLRMCRRGDFTGLIIQDGVCPGTVTNALIEKPDSSEFISGALCPNRPAILTFQHGSHNEATFHDAATGAKFNFFVQSFARIKDLPGDVILGVNGTLSSQSDRYSRINVYIAQRDGKEVSAPLIFERKIEESTLHKWRSNQVLSAIGALHQLGLWIRDHSGSREEIVFPDSTELIIQRSQFVHLSDTISTIKTESDRAWRAIAKVLKQTGHNEITIGESFTGGAFASLAHSLPGMSRFFSNAVVWYDKSFKAAFGVDEDYLKQSRIVSAETTFQCARALMWNTPGRFNNHARTAIATNGWTNLGEGIPDRFSVSVVDYGGRPIERSADVFVTGVQSLEKSDERKAITRLVGVAAAEMLFGEVLAQRYSAHRATLEPAMERLNDLVQTFGIVRLAGI